MEMEEIFYKLISIKQWIGNVTQTKIVVEQTLTTILLAILNASPVIVLIQCAINAHLSNQKFCLNS